MLVLYEFLSYNKETLSVECTQLIATFYDT